MGRDRLDCQCRSLGRDDDRGVFGQSACCKATVAKSVSDGLAGSDWE